MKVRAKNRERQKQTKRGGSNEVVMSVVRVVKVFKSLKTKYSLSSSVTVVKL